MISTFNIPFTMSVDEVQELLSAASSEIVDAELQSKMDLLLPLIHKERNGRKRSICITMAFESNNQALHTAMLAVDIVNKKIIYISSDNGSILDDNRKINGLNVTPFQLASHIQSKTDENLPIIDETAAKGLKATRAVYLQL